MVVHRCLKCKKTFDSPSKLERHKNKKTPCNAPKKEYKCAICNVNFISPAQQKIHENTKKHIGNISVVGNNNIINSTNNSYNNIIHLTLNTRFNNENYNNFINYLKSHLLNDNEEAIKLQPIINKKLSQMYIDFNDKQNKPERKVKDTFDEKLDEYLNYRNKECTLGNGFTPEIINSQFKKIN